MEEEESEAESIGKHSLANSQKVGDNRIVGNEKCSEGYDITMTEREKLRGNVKITMEDIKEEIVYLRSVVICYVLGSNPPKQLWRDTLTEYGVHWGLTKSLKLTGGAHSTISLNGEQRKSGERRNQNV